MEKHKRVIQKQKFKVSTPTWKEKFELPDRSYFVSDIKDYFKYIIKKREGVTDNLPIRRYVNKIENRITFMYAEYTRYFLAETMKLLGITKNKITKVKNGENVKHLEITEIVLFHCNIFNNTFQHNSRVLYIFISNRSYSQLLDISPKNVIFLIY